MREIWPVDDAGAVGAGRASRRLRLSRGRRRRAVSRSGVSRRGRIFAGTLCGLVMALFPGLAVLVLQICLVAAWAYLMLSLVAGALREAGSSG